MKKTLLILATALLSTAIYAQNVGINTDGSDPADSVLVEVKTTNGATLPTSIISVVNDNNGATNRTGFQLYNSVTGANSLWNLYNPGSGSTDFRINNAGNDYMTILNSGNVGIGTTAPTVTLDVDGDAIFNESGADVDFRVEGNGNAAMLFVDASTRRVGIGSNTPDKQLTVLGGAHINSGSTSNATIIEGSSNASLFYVDAANNRVGIATDSPTGKLHVHGDGVVDGGIITRFTSDDNRPFDIYSPIAGDLTSPFQLYTLNAFEFLIEEPAGVLSTLNIEYDADVRIESDNNANMLFVDYSADAVGIGTESPASGLDVQNSMGLAHTTVTTTATLNQTHNVVLASDASGSFTITLPAAASNSGKVYYIKKTNSSSNAITIDGNGGETIDGATTLLLYVQYDAIRILCDGSNWHIIADERIPHSCLLKRNTTQSLPSFFSTVIDLNQEIVDVGGIGDPTTNNRIDIKRAGNYEITASVTLPINDATEVEVKILLNGSTIGYYIATSSFNNWNTASTTILHPLSAGDYIEMSVRHDEGTAVSTVDSFVVRPSLHLIEIR